MPLDPLTKMLRYRWLIFALLALGYMLVFFHRICPAVLAVDLMHDLKAGGALTGLLGAVYFYPYAVMQLPAGLLSDSWGPRNTITLFFGIACGDEFGLKTLRNLGRRVAEVTLRVVN